MWLPKTEELAEYHWLAGEYLRGAYCQAERWDFLFEEENTDSGVSDMSTVWFLYY